MLNLVRVFSEKSGEILFDNQMRSAQMRIIFFAGKGGVGKTSTAAATGIKAAEMGLRTVVMSLDVAHSLADIFDLEQELMDQNRGTPVKVKDNLWIQELLAVFPGMEEVSLLLYINQYVQNNEFDVVLLDCAPTGESLRFISIPTTLEWYMKKKMWS
jgi:arsenite-transporting ATPase